MIKIAIIITDITGIGGIERVTQCLSNALSENKKYEISIISCFKRNFEPSYPINKNVKIIYVTENDYNLNNSILSRSILIIKCIKGLHKILINSKYDIVITQAFLPSFLLYISKIKVKNIICEHFKYELYSKKITKIRNYIYKQATKVVTLTDADKQKYHEVGIDAITIPNMISFPIINHNFSGKRMISIGRLHEQKGYDLLIPAMLPVFRHHKDWCLDIYGEGDERENLQSQIDTLGLSAYITLKGYSQNIQSELTKSDICLVSSRYEGFPMAIVESLASGVPVVSFDCPEGPAELLKNNAGILIKVGDIDAFSVAVNKMIEDSDLKESCRINGYKNISEYSPENIINKWHSLFQEILTH